MESAVTRFPDKMREKEQAEEDRYFARRDRELLAALKAKAKKDTPLEAEAPEDSAEELRHTPPSPRCR
jgi:hypothetical protein